MSTPPAVVLDGFRVSDRPVRLPGGRGTTWRAGDVVLKPVDSPVEHAWVSAAYAAWPAGAGVRVPSPLPTPDGSWSLAGWGAYCWIEASELLPGDDPRAFRAAGRAFHAVTRSMAAPDFLATRTDQWARGDRIAWGDEAASGSGRVRDLLDEVLGLLQPVELPAQVVHGDLPGNVLTSADGPVVIDWAPYFRPAGWALAVVAVDAVCWQGASLSLVDDWADEPSWSDLLLRALAYRLATRALVGDAGVDLPETDVLVAALARRR